MLLPLLNLALWVVLIPVPATLVYLNLHQEAQRTGRATIHAGAYTASIPSDRVLRFALNSAGTKHSELITALNIPGMFGELLVSSSISSPNTWPPAIFSWESWRAISFPFFALPLWIFVGEGIDRLVRRQRLHWGSLLFGTILCLAFLVIFAGFRFCTPAADRNEDGWLIWGFGPWSLFFGVFPFAWIRQRRSLSERQFPEQS